MCARAHVCACVCTRAELHIKNALLPLSLSSPLFLPPIFPFFSLSFSPLFLCSCFIHAIPRRTCPGARKVKRNVVGQVLVLELKKSLSLTIQLIAWNYSIMHGKQRLNPSKIINAILIKFAKLIGLRIYNAIFSLTFCFTTKNVNITA